MELQRSESFRKKTLTPTSKDGEQLLKYLRNLAIIYHDFLVCLSYLPKPTADSHYMIVIIAKKATACNIPEK